MSSLEWQLIELAYTESRNVISDKHVNAVIAKTIESISTHLSHFWANLDTQEKAFLKALAKNRTIKKFSKNTIGKLKNKRIISGDHGRYRFNAPLLEEGLKTRRL